MIEEKFLQTIVERILKVIKPEKIILFGSHAYGRPSTHSDLDLLIIVKESKLPRYRRAVPINLALCDIDLSFDILVYTEKEVEEWKDVPQAFITSIIKKGKVIYEREKN
ncbi:nucleotidyltransferase domain-containing protein [bacterium]|nr:MAG: nucleotidyltransferase domain-containing protein [bacterium]